MGPNVSLPFHVYCYVRQSFLFGGRPKKGLIPGVLHGVSSTPSRSLGFHVLLENGARWSDLPLHALASRRENVEALPLDEISYWDCLSWSVSAVAYEYLRDMDVIAKLRSGREEKGRYLMTFDWTHSGFSEDPAQHKEIHLIELACGAYALLPNYKAAFLDSSFVEFSGWPKYTPQSTVWYSE